MYLISYICAMKTDEKHYNIKELYLTSEFMEFYEGLQDAVKCKFDRPMDIIRTEYVISSKFVKHLINTNLYEMRVSINTNEYRTILFAVDDDNIIESTKVVLLNSFQKKSAKEYK